MRCIIKILTKREIHRSFKSVFLAIFFILLVIFAGMFGFMRLEGLKPIDALYLTVVTLSTVGYGDFYPTTQEAKIFTIFLIIFGVSAFLYAFSTLSMTIFEGHLMEVLKLEEAKDELRKMRNHVILCGYGDVGSYIAEGLDKDEVVVVELDENRIQSVIENDMLCVKGDSTRPETLKEAGVENAKAMIIALNSDPDVVFTILTAKEMNPDLRIYARANKKESVSKMKWAGANHVVCLPDIGGRDLIKALKSGE